MLYETGSEIFRLSQIQLYSAAPKNLAHEAMIQITTPRQLFIPKEFESCLSLIKSTSTNKYILIPMITSLVGFIWPQPVTNYMPTPISIPTGGSKAGRTNMGGSSLRLT